MGKGRRSRPYWRAMLAGLLAASVAGCVSMPSGGPVLSYTVTQGGGGQGQHYVQIIPKPPGPGWNPVDIVNGFLSASASFVGQHEVAREYLTPSANSVWKPSWSATVFQGDGPSVTLQPAAPAAPGAPVAAAAATRAARTAAGQRAQVVVSGQVQASLSSSGSYAVTSGTQGQSRFTFHLVRYGGQWRIAAPLPGKLLLTSVEFQADYQLRNLYFFDPAGAVLVPDPVYVPLQATPTNLLNGLVQDLIQPPPDWLAAATKTAFPSGTNLAGNVTLDGGTASVNLTGAAVLHASTPVRRQISAQLLLTLSGSGQGQPLVQYIQLDVDGKPWIPPGAPNGDPVQYAPIYQPPSGAYGTFYYLDAHGVLWSQKGPSADPVKVGGPPRPSLSAIAVSPGGQYLAGLDNGNVYVGPLSGRLTRRASGSYTALSWDTSGNLWAAEASGAGGSGVVLLRADGGGPVQVNLLNSNGTEASGTVTALRVAPDGVRVALVIDGIDGKQLRFGAITVQGQGHAPTVNAMVTLSPFSVSAAVTSMTWYGADDVIALSGAALTEYPVNGGTSVQIASEPRMASITASWSNALIAGLTNGTLAANPSTTGSWGEIGSGLSPVYPG